MKWQNNLHFTCYFFKKLGDELPYLKYGTIGLLFFTFLLRIIRFSNSLNKEILYTVYNTISKLYATLIDLYN